MMNQTPTDNLIPAIASGHNPGPPPPLPPEAVREYRTLLWELNRWCRDHGASPQLNLWVAEHAIRETWD